jgi:hypothetical protein
MRSGSLILLGLAVLGFVALRGEGGPAKPSPSTRPRPGRGPRPGAGAGGVTFAAGASYALTFDAEGGWTMTEPELLKEVLAAVEALGMTPLPGSPAAGDPAHVQARSSATRKLPVPLHFKDTPRKVYLLSVTPLGPPIAGWRAVA